MKYITFKTNLITAIICGTKTQTRRKSNPQPKSNSTYRGVISGADNAKNTGKYRFDDDQGYSMYLEPKYNINEVLRMEDTDTSAHGFIKITDIKLERLLDISEADAIAEGVEHKDNSPEALYLDYFHANEFVEFAAESFISLWASIYGIPATHANPWVFVYDFVLCDKNGRELEA